VKLKIGLPLAQMFLALVLLRWGGEWFRADWRVCDSPGPSPVSDLLVSINMPAVLMFDIPAGLIGFLRYPWYPYLGVPFPWDWAMLTAAVGLFWYWVSLNIQSWRQRRAVLMFSRRWLRIGADVLLILAGLLWALYGVNQIRRAAWSLHGYSCFGPFAWLPESLAACLNLAWALAVVYFFGRDLYFGSKARSTTSSIVFT